MNPDSDEIDGVDEGLAAWIESYEEVTCTEDGSDTRAELASQLPLEFQAKLTGVKKCLDLLSEMRESLALPTLPRVAFEEASSNDAPEHCVGRFEIIETLGAGGFGIVYRAWDPLTQREVALKVPRPEALVSAEMQRRFEHEARAAAKLDHPYIVQILEAGVDRGVPYIASVFYRAVTVADWLKEQTRSITPRAAAELVAKLADALNHAHQRGVLHRDIKPSNILLVPTAAAVSDPMLARLPLGEYQPKVSDFGLAKLLEGGSDQTRSGLVIGTLSYMSPEQAEGRVRDISERSDVYALGAVLYELLTGRAPFLGDTDRATLHQILMQEPAAPSNAVQELSRDLEAICLKCLEKDTAARYQMAHELAADLDRFLQGQPTKARPLGPLQRLTKWSRRRPAIAALSSVLAASLITIFIGSVVYSSRLRHSLAEVSAQRAVAEQAVQDTKLTLYAADMQRAQEAWRHNHISQVAQYLDAHEPKAGEPDRREFTWYYLHGLCSQELATLEGHEGDVFAIAASPDGKLWGSGGKDGTVRLWDTATRTQVAVFRGHDDEVTDVEFSPSDNLIASASEDGTIRLWPTDGKGEHRAIHASAVHVLDIAFSPDGQLIASAGREKPLRVWNTNTLVQVAELPGHAAYFEAVSFGKDGQTLVAADDLGFAYSWRVSDWLATAELFFNREKYLTLATSPFDGTITGAGRYRRIPLWNIKDSAIQPRAELQDGHLEWIQALAFSPLNGTLASADKVGVIQLWNTEKQSRRSVLGHKDQVWSLAWSPDGKVLASAGGSGVIRLWDGLGREDASTMYPPILHQIQRIAYSADGQALYATSSDPHLTRFDVETRTIAQCIVRQGDQVETLVTTSSGAFLMSRPAENQLGVAEFNGEPPRHIVDAAGFKSDSSLSLRSDAHYFAWDDSKTTATIVSANCKERFTLQSDALIDSVEFSPDNVHLAVLTQENVKLWNCDSKRWCTEFPRAAIITFSPDGSLIALQRNGGMRLFDVVTGALRQSFVNRPERIQFMAISSDNKTLAVINELNNQVTLFDIRSGQELISLTVEAIHLNCVAFSPLGDRLAVSGQDTGRQGRVWEWRINQR